MLTVHHLDHSQSIRIVWLLEELKASGNNAVDYELKLYERNQTDRLAPPEYKALSPLGTAPTITTSEGLVMNESNAILEYIVDLAGDNGSSFRPSSSSPDRGNFLFWFHSVQGSMQPMLTVDIVFRHAAIKAPCPIGNLVGVVGSKVRDAIVMPRLKNIVELAETQLTKHDFLAGSDLTVADISAIYPFASLFTRYPELCKPYPNCKKWLDRMMERPALKAAQQKVGEEGGIVFESE
ncbi:Glutathione S-transferase [Seminavis robusta]|uniref:Glutathione S-transferase n=1 Tax=Seminavis robusta TaxID=568900 RepID=A0A9N8H531_9STRA|nr:Glutathione S-transferase [Seminavis robusta]|eukprot:Sro17_g012290.1 Glutathione S-transferase (237) ;mRNA; f:73912-74622